MESFSLAWKYRGDVVCRFTGASVESHLGHASGVPQPHEDVISLSVDRWSLIPEVKGDKESQ